MKNPLTDTISIFARTGPELEEFLLFSILVAQKPADVTQKKLAGLLAETPAQRSKFYDNGFGVWKAQWVDQSPFDRMRTLLRQCRLGRALRKHKVGQYKRIGAAIRAVVGKVDKKGVMAAGSQLNVYHCGIEELERVPGIGPKTSRFFLLHTRPGVRFAVLDTHILKWLRDTGVANVPRSTPSKGPEYTRLENAFLELADRKKVNPADLDYSIWVTYAEEHRKKKGG